MKMMLGAAMLALTATQLGAQDWKKCPPDCPKEPCRFYVQVYLDAPWPGKPSANVDAWRRAHPNDYGYVNDMGKYDTKELAVARIITISKEGFFADSDVFFMATAIKAMMVQSTCAKDTKP